MQPLVDDASTTSSLRSSSNSHRRCRRTLQDAAAALEAQSSEASNALSMMAAEPSPTAATDLISFVQHRHQTSTTSSTTMTASTSSELTNTSAASIPNDAIIDAEPNSPAYIASTQMNVATNTIPKDEGDGGLHKAGCKGASSSGDASLTTHAVIESSTIPCPSLCHSYHHSTDAVAPSPVVFVSPATSNAVTPRVMTVVSSVSPRCDPVVDVAAPSPVEHELSVLDGRAAPEGAPSVAAQSTAAPPVPHHRSMTTATTASSSPPHRQRSTTTTSVATDSSVVVAHLRLLLQDRNVAVSKLSDEITLLKSAMRDAGREHDAVTVTYRAEVSSLEVKLRVVQMEHDALRMKLRQTDDAYRSECVKHRDCRAQLNASDKELLNLRQAVDGHAKQSEQGNRVLREKLNDAKRQLTESQRLVRSLQQQLQTDNEQTYGNTSYPGGGSAAAAPTSHSNDAECTAADPAAVDPLAVLPQRLPPQPPVPPLTVPPQPPLRHHSTGMGSAATTAAGAANTTTVTTARSANQRLRAASSAILSAQRGVNSLGTTQFQREASTAAPITAIAKPTTALAVPDGPHDAVSARMSAEAHQQEVSDLKLIIDRLTAERQLAQDAAAMSEALQAEKIHVLEEELCQTTAREVEWKQRLDNLTDSYEDEVSRLSAQLSKWREDQNQQQATLLSARSRSVAQPSGPPGGSVVAGFGSRANSLALIGFEHNMMMATGTTPGTPIPSAGPASVVATPTAAPPFVYSRYFQNTSGGGIDDTVSSGYGAVYSPEIQGPPALQPATTAMLLAVGTEAQLREYIRELESELTRANEKCALLEESRRGLLSDIEVLKDTVALYQGPWEEDKGAARCAEQLPMSARSLHNRNSASINNNVHPVSGNTQHQQHSRRATSTPAVLVATTADDDRDSNDGERQMTATNVSTTAGLSSAVLHHQQQPLVRQLQEEISFLRRQLHLRHWFDANAQDNQQQQQQQQTQHFNDVMTDESALLSHRAAEDEPPARLREQQHSIAASPRSLPPPRPTSVAQRRRSGSGTDERLAHRLPSHVEGTAAAPDRAASKRASSPRLPLQAAAGGGSVASRTQYAIGYSDDDTARDDDDAQQVDRQGLPDNPLDDDTSNVTEAALAAASTQVLRDPSQRRDDDFPAGAPARRRGASRRQLVVTVPEVSAATMGYMLASALIGGALATIGKRK